MNVIFLDFDGVLDTAHYIDENDLENRIKLLGYITHANNAKIVIESSHKECIDEETLETDSGWINHIFELFDKYGIVCIGRTPSIRKYTSKNSYVDIWKEFEIITYLKKHPEIKHFCVIDDDDLGPLNSDLNLVRDYLVQTIFYDKDETKEGLLPKHALEVKHVLEKENRFNGKK